jgi:hypothetical protein
MTDLRDRLAEIIKDTMRLGHTWVRFDGERDCRIGGLDRDDCLGIADALLASEEWKAREAIIDEVANEHFAMSDLARLADLARAILAAARGTT